MEQTGFKLNRKALFGAMVLAAAGAMPAYAATINVTTTADAITDDAVCSLREAVIAINTGDVGASGCADSAGNGFGTDDTIVLGTNTYVLTIPGSTSEDYYATGVAPDPAYVLVTDPDATIGDLDLTKSVTIVGAGMGQTIIDGGALDRVFQIVADPTNAAVTINVTLSNLTVRNGLVKWEQITPPAGDGSYWLFKKLGGGIATGVAAAVTEYVPADHGQGSGGAGDHGQARGNEGGEEEVGPTYGLTLTNVGVLNNVSQGDAGGIYNITPMVASGLLVEGNRSDANGGGIYNEGNSTITNSTIRGNIAEGGGGLFATGSNTVTISGTTINANRAVGGGAVSGRADVTINVTNSTLSGNLTRDVGAGFYHNGPANLRFVTIANNVAGSDAPFAGSGLVTFPSGSANVSVKNVLLAANKTGWPSDVVEGDPVDLDLYKTAPIPQPGDAEFLALTGANCGGTGSGNAPDITSNGYNLSSDGTCAAVLNLTTDKNNLDPLIGPLADNNAGTTGTTFTHALLDGSPALGAGGAEVDVTTDQRGVTRQTPPDIGAFELVTTDPTPNDLTDNGGGGGGGCAVGGDGRLDPTMPAMLAAALAFFGLRRRAGK